MRRTGRHIARVALVGWLVAAGVALAANVELSQSVDRTELGDEDTFRLTVSLSGGDPDDLVLPRSEDFEVLSRQSRTQMSIQMGGGRTGMQRTTVYTLVMRANRTGKLTLPPSEIRVGNKMVRSEAITLTVKKGRLGPPPGQAQRPPRSGFPGFPGFPSFPGFPEDDEPGGPGFPDMDIPRSDSDLFLQASLDKGQVYVGEQVTFSVYLMSRVDLSSVDQLSLPKMDGFWTEEMESPTQLAGEQKVIDGVPYRAYLLKRRAIFPMRPGKVDIGRVEADVTTGFMFAGHRIHRKSKALVLDVKPLPPGAPPGFAPSNVGQWQVSVQVADPKVALGQPATVRVVLGGVGNIRNITPPKLTGPLQVKIYDPTPSEQVTTQRGRVEGRRVNEYLVMANQTGTFTLPPVSFPYFDPRTGEYQVTQSDPLTLTIEPGSGVSQSSPNAPAKNVLSGGGLRPLRPRARFEGPPIPPWRQSWFAPSVLTPMAAWLAFALTGFLRRRWATEAEDVRKQRAKAALARLSEARKLESAGTPAQFYGEVEKALVGYLEATMGVPLGGLRREALLETLARSQVSEQARQRVARVLDACDVGRFAPGASDGNRRQVLDDAAKAMEAPL
jgi:hypothetical protein